MCGVSLSRYKRLQPQQRRQTLLMGCNVAFSQSVIALFLPTLALGPCHCFWFREPASRKGPGGMEKPRRNLGNVRRPLSPQGRPADRGTGGERWQPLVSELDTRFYLQLLVFGVTGGRGDEVSSFVSCLCRLTVDRAPLARRGSALCPYRGTLNVGRSFRYSRISRFSFLTLAWTLQRRLSLAAWYMSRGVGVVFSEVQAVTPTAGDSCLRRGSVLPVPLLSSLITLARFFGDRFSRNVWTGSARSCPKNDCDVAVYFLSC